MWKVVQKFVRNLVYNEDSWKWRRNYNQISDLSSPQIAKGCLNFNIRIELDKEGTFEKAREAKEKDNLSRFKLKSYKKEWSLGGNV